MQVVTDIKYVFIAITSLLLSSNFIYGQSIKGIVIDGDHTPLGFVNILLKNPQDSTIIDFAITNNAGKFEFDTIPLNGILLSTSAIGYASFDTMLYQVSKQSEINLSIQLANKDYDLQQVEVNAYKNGVIINGDTTIYDPSTFTTGQEENVEELLKKLPGIVVEDGGKISVGGKEVENVLIEGDDFLDENRKAVLEGLSAESVSSVEIIGNYEAYSDLADFNTESEQKYAINIKLTKDAKSKIHGNVQLSGGHEDRYEAIADLYKIKEKSKFFINANTGNTGQNTLSIYDYIQLEGGLQNFTEQRSKGDRKIPRIFLDKERYNQINSNYLGFNFSKNIGSKLEMDGFAFAYLNNSKSSSVKRETPSHLGITNIYDKSKNDQLKTLAAKFNLDFKPSKKENWNYSSKVLLENTAETLQNRTQFFGNRFESQNHTTSEPFQIQNQINYRNRINKSNHLSFQVYSKWRKFDRNRLIASDTILPFFSSDNSFSSKSIDQKTANQKHNLDISAVYRKRIKFLNLQSKLYWNREDLDLEISDLPNLDFIASFEPSNWQRDYIGYKQGVNYKKGNLSTGVGINWFNFKVQQESTAEVSNRNYFVPSAFLKIQFNPFQQSFRLAYNNKVQAADLELANNAVEIVELNKLYQFNVEGSQILTGKHIELFYNLFDAVSGTMLFLFSNFSKSEAIGNQYFYFPTYELRKTTEIPPQELWINGLVIDKKFYRTSIGARLKSFVGYQKDYTYVEDLLNVYQNNSFKLELGAYSIWKESPMNAEMIIEYNQTQFNTGESKLSSKERIAGLKLTWSLFNEKLLWKSGIDIILEKRGNINNKYYNLNGKIRCNLPKVERWRLAIIYNDLLNLNATQRVSANRIGNNVSTEVTNILPGFVLCNIQYEF